MSVASKNLFDLLGNDPEEAPQAPVIPVDKTAARHGKRVETAPKDAGPPPATRGGRGGRRGDNNTGSERAFQDRDAGRGANRGRSTEERGGGRGERRGGRGGPRGRGPRGEKFDRHSRTGVTDSDKQASKGWGEESGVGELRDEQAGDAQAAEERRAGVVADSETPRGADGEVPATENGTGEAAAVEAEEKQKTLADWQAEQEEKKRALGANLSIRKANEGAGKDAPEGKALERENAQDFFIGTGGKKQRERERKDRSNQLVLEHDYATREAPSTTSRGGRGGGRGRGERGARGDGFRGGRGGDRGDRGAARGPRGAPGGASRGARGGVTPNIGDPGAFPTLGS